MSAKELAALAAPTIKLVPCPDLKAEIAIRKPPMSQQLRILDRLQELGVTKGTKAKDMDKGKLLELQRDLLGMCVCDEAGNPVWDAKQVDTFQAAQVDSAGVLFDAIVELLGMTEAQDEGKDE